MTLLSEQIRPYWMPGLNEVDGQVQKGLGGWLLDGEYQLYDPLEEGVFKLSVSKKEKLCESFAYDCSRMATASFETANQIRPVEFFPKAIAWFVIKQYYAAFYAAHAISRMLGSSYSQINNNHAKAVLRVAKLFENDMGRVPSKGLYRCTYNESSATLLCERLNASKGPHEAFWVEFTDLINQIKEKIISKKKDPGNEQRVFIQLSDLIDCLCHSSSSNGTWLSFMRNEVNYRHSFEAWFPYSGVPRNRSEIFSDSELWLKDTANMELGSFTDDFKRFKATCSFIISFCREMVLDMSIRCAKGNSFHNFTSVAFLNHRRGSRR